MEYLNLSKDANQVWHRYDKALGNKKNNIVERNAFMIALQGHMFSKMNSYLKNPLTITTKNKKQGKTYDNTSKTNIENKFKSVTQTDFTLSNDTFFCEDHIQDTMNQSNKNSSPSPECTYPELVLNEAKNLVAALNILIQASYRTGYFLKPWKKEN